MEEEEEEEKRGVRCYLSDFLLLFFAVVLLARIFFLNLDVSHLIYL